MAQPCKQASLGIWPTVDGALLCPADAQRYLLAGHTKITHERRKNTEEFAFMYEFVDFMANVSPEVAAHPMHLFMAWITDGFVPWPDGYVQPTPGPWHEGQIIDPAQIPPVPIHG